jgi:hypothetical protein
MMRLVKGAKETFGWVSVRSGREIVIPLQAWERYGFQVGEKAFFLRGSRKSGGFGLTNHKLLAGCSLPRVEERILGVGWFTLEREVCIPENIPVNPGDRLLTVFGSGLALGFVSQGPIYAEALQHPELDELKEV